MPQTDPEDQGEPPEPAHTSQPSAPFSDLSKKSALIIGQATAAITIAAAVVYAAGGLALGLKLWYDQYSWEPVLGQLPRSFVLVYALIAIAPAIIAGLLAYLIYKRVTGNGKSQLSEVKSWLLAVALAIILGIVPLVFLPFVRRTTFHGVIRPHWQIFVACFVFNLVFVRLALYLLPKVQIPGLQEITCIGVCTFALIPAVASVTATYRFPDVRLCGQSFADSGTHDNYAVGNLIGTSGQWIYIAETITRSPRPGKYIFIGSYIAVIPLSEVQLEGIGADANCGDIHAPVRSG